MYPTPQSSRFSNDGPSQMTTKHSWGYLSIKYGCNLKEGSVAAFTYVHCCVDLCYGLIVQWELVDLDPIADQLAHDFDLELVQLALTDGVSFGDHWDDVDLKQAEAHNKRP